MLIAITLPLVEALPHPRYISCKVKPRKDHDKCVSVEPERSEVIHGPNLGGFLGLAPDL